MKLHKQTQVDTRFNLDMLTAFRTSGGRIKYLQSKIFEAECLLNDYNHFLELYELDDYEMLTISRKIRDTLRTRRVLIDEKQLIVSALGEINGSSEEGLHPTFEEHFSRIKGGRTFVPRCTSLEKCLED